MGREWALSLRDCGSPIPSARHSGISGVLAMAKPRHGTQWDFGGPGPHIISVEDGPSSHPKEVWKVLGDVQMENQLFLKLPPPLGDIRHRGALFRLVTPPGNPTGRRSRTRPGLPPGSEPSLLQPAQCAQQPPPHPVRSSLPSLKQASGGSRNPSPHSPAALLVSASQPGCPGPGMLCP